MAPAPPIEALRRPCRLLHLVSTFAIKTDTKWLVQIARHLDREAFVLSAACFYEGGPIRDQLEALGVQTYNLDMPDERDPRAVLRARRLIEDCHCDVVHTHLLRADLFGGAAARWAGTPAIVSTVYAVGQYRREKRRRTDRLLDVACAALPTHVIAVSEAVKRDCVDRLRLRPDDITVIHTGIDAPETIDAGRAAGLREQWGGGAAGPFILTIARLTYEKGVDTLVDVASLLRHTHPNVRFIVLGEGPDRSALEAKIQASGLIGVVTLAGFCEEVWPALAAADIVCLPSKSEGMPNVLLEAMAVGKPIVATSVGGIPEAITSGQNGLLVEAGDPRALAKGIARLSDDKTLAQRLGVAAKRAVEARFRARDAVAQYAKVYERLLLQPGGKRAGAATAI
ncbi:MAG TPA: glycosyltransferase [Phycisphaerae bacterium]|nr:glycosyltransferase [Phycisphaerae bacterium]